MSVPTPHYLLFSEASRGCDSGRWRFTLRAADGSEQFEAADVEPTARGERLDLLTVVRALESLDQPSRVTLAGCSPYVRQGMQYGLSDWCRNGWRWESFGQMVPVKNRDLWQRIDRALRFHRVECRQWRRDPAHSLVPHLRVVRSKKIGEEDTGLGIHAVAGRLVEYWRSACELALGWKTLVSWLKEGTRTRSSCLVRTR